MAAQAVSVSAADRYLFDLNGFLVVRGVLSADEVASANAAIDRHQGYTLDFFLQFLYSLICYVADSIPCGRADSLWWRQVGG